MGEQGSSDKRTKQNGEIYQQNGGITKIMPSYLHDSLCRLGDPRNNKWLVDVSDLLRPTINHQP